MCSKCVLELYQIYPKTGWKRSKAKEILTYWPSRITTVHHSKGTRTKHPHLQGNLNSVSWAQEEGREFHDVQRMYYQGNNLRDFILITCLTLSNTFLFIFGKGEFKVHRGYVFYSDYFLYNAHKNELDQVKSSSFMARNACVTSNGVFTCKKALPASSAWYLSSIFTLFTFFHFTFPTH